MSALLPSAERKRMSRNCSDSDKELAVGRTSQNGHRDDEGDWAGSVPGELSACRRFRLGWAGDRGAWSAASACPVPCSLIPSLRTRSPPLCSPRPSGGGAEARSHRGPGRRYPRMGRSPTISEMPKFRAGENGARDRTLALQGPDGRKPPRPAASAARENPRLPPPREHRWCPVPFL